MTDALYVLLAIGTGFAVLLVPYLLYLTIRVAHDAVRLRLHHRRWRANSRHWRELDRTLALRRSAAKLVPLSKDILPRLGESAIVFHDAINPGAGGITCRVQLVRVTDGCVIDISPYNPRIQRLP